MSEALTLDTTRAGTGLLRATQIIPVPPALVFPFFANAGNLARITPPDTHFEITSASPGAMREGTLIDYRIRVWGARLRWRTVISRWDPPHEFVDEQLRGPYAEWVHVHRFTATPNGATLMCDEVRFRLPFGRVGGLAAPLVRRELRRIFLYRRASIAAAFP